jgi:hypothetical protein
MGLDHFDETFAERIAEAEEFYRSCHSEKHHSEDENASSAARVTPACCGPNNSSTTSSATGSRAEPRSRRPPCASRPQLRLAALLRRDILSMPDKWEYPWFAAWDTAFHMIPFAAIDPDFAKHQLLLLLREWYMHPNGQLPAYEWNFSDVNPPVHAWAVWRVYKIADPKGHRDLLFLERAFQKLLLNFTWWVNRKDVEGRHVFGGGFLGLTTSASSTAPRRCPAAAISIRRTAPRGWHRSAW